MARNESTNVPIRCAVTTFTLIFASAVHAQFDDDPEGVDLQSRGKNVQLPAVSARSVLTPTDRLVLETSFQYIHSKATEVAIEGFAVIPAVAIGLFNVSQVQRDTVSQAFALKFGLSPRAELDIRVPFLYKTETVRERQVFEASRVDVLRGSSGYGLGDVELGYHFQLNQGGVWPFMVANLRFKTTSGVGPFDVSRRTLKDSDGKPIGEVFQEQPTGSGFYAVNPSLSFLYPSSPAVFHGSLSYLWNVKDDVGGQSGTVDPGDAIGMSFGMGFAINDRASFSMAYDHSLVLKTKLSNSVGIEPTFDRLQVGSFMLGASYRVQADKSVNVGLGIGVTSAAPDVNLSLRMPVIFGG